MISGPTHDPIARNEDPVLLEALLIRREDDSIAPPMISPFAPYAVLVPRRFSVIVLILAPAFRPTVADLRVDASSAAAPGTRIASGRSSCWDGGCHQGENVQARGRAVESQRFGPSQPRGVTIHRTSEPTEHRNLTIQRALLGKPF